MSANKTEWTCCGDITITDAWEPKECPFCEILRLREENERLRENAKIINELEQLAARSNNDLLVENERLANDMSRCYRMLLSEPDAKGALFKAENILRESLADRGAK